MALMELLLAGVGPFEKTRLDFSDGQGKPHMGPHIIAGVNGCGKTTALRAIGATVSCPVAIPSGFPFEWWRHRLERWDKSAAVTVWSGKSTKDLFARVVLPAAIHDLPSTIDWIHETSDALQGVQLPQLNSYSFEEVEYYYLLPNEGELGDDLVAAYSPSVEVKDLSPLEIARGSASSKENALAFEGTVDAATVQVWLQNLRFSVSRAKEQEVASEEFGRPLRIIESALTEIMGLETEIDVEPGIEPKLKLRMGAQSLNLSQLPDGARNLLGWLVDFVRRRETAEWPAELKESKPSVLLVDEVDAHLHPKWQRTILPALKKAFAGEQVQIIVTTHSPFVISSCEGARVHVLDVDEKGHATARPPIDAPVGQSVSATIMGVFGVDSRFDVDTERMLKRWDELRRAKAAETLDSDGQKELNEITDRLANRSEELRILVGAIPEISERRLQQWLLG